jgi:phosphoribosylaminoimidazole-succinocarboxamide synthase
MAKHSPTRKSIPLLEGLPLLHRGKVRDTYGLSDGNILIVATDAISIFDFELNALVPMKGTILTAFTVYWFRFLETHGIKTHLVAAGSSIDRYLPEHLRNNYDLQSRAIVANKFEMAPVEFIVRGCITGSGLDAYNKTGAVCGTTLPEGLEDGDKLPFPIDTPTTKATVGHDIHLNAEDVRSQYPKQTETALKVFGLMQKFIESRGFIFADTKFEFAEDGTLCDEISPDSSRVWGEEDWNASRKASPKKAPPSYDKEIVRSWGKSEFINKRDPEDSEDVYFVHSLHVPESVIWSTTMAYRYLFWRLTGMTVEEYLQNVLYVHYPVDKKKIVIVCGSESDLGVVKAAMGSLNVRASIKVHVMSCHRNPKEVMDFIANLSDHVDIIIGVGGKAFALPGIMEAWVHAFGKQVRVGGVAVGNPKSQAFEAARLSILELPGQPVVMDEFTGEPYAGSHGLTELITRICQGEIPPPRPRAEKTVKMDIDLLYRNDFR